VLKIYQIEDVAYATIRPCNGPVTAEADSESDFDSDDLEDDSGIAASTAVRDPTPDEVSQLQRAFDEADAVLIAAGAGMSLDSGLPDLRLARDSRLSSCRPIDHCAGTQKHGRRRIRSLKRKD
jgi:hypothetical protein